MNLQYLRTPRQGNSSKRNTTRNNNTMSNLWQHLVDWLCDLKNCKRLVNEQKTKVIEDVLECNLGAFHDNGSKIDDNAFITLLMEEAGVEADDCLLLQEKLGSKDMCQIRKEARKHLKRKRTPEELEELKKQEEHEKQAQEDYDKWMERVVMDGEEKRRRYEKFQRIKKTLDKDHPEYEYELIKLKYELNIY